MKMPVPTTPTFGDLRPASVQMPVPKPKKTDDKPRRQLKPGCTFPKIETYRQTNGPLHLSRFKYNGCSIVGIADDEASAIDNAQQFYMRETTKGRKDSEVIDQ